MSIYKTYDADQMQLVQSQFLIDSWSYSKVTAFARHEKHFEMSYIYGLYGRKSATTIAGNAYHEALQYYFVSRQQDETPDLAELEMCAYAYIERVAANE